MGRGKNIGIVIVSLFLATTGLTVIPDPPEVDVTKEADPTDIMLAGSGLSPEETTITLTVRGYGGTTTEARPIDVVYGIDSSASLSFLLTRTSIR